MEGRGGGLALATERSLLLGAPAIDGRAGRLVEADVVVGLLLLADRLWRGAAVAGFACVESRRLAVAGVALPDGAAFEAPAILARDGIFVGD